MRACERGRFGLGVTKNAGWDSMNNVSALYIQRRNDESAPSLVVRPLNVKGAYVVPRIPPGVLSASFCAMMDGP